MTREEFNRKWYPIYRVERYGTVYDGFPVWVLVHCDNGKLFIVETIEEADEAASVDCNGWI